MKKAVFVFGFAFLLIASCNKEKDSKEEFVFTAPANLPATKYNFTNNPVTTAGFILGRKLFYDATLSRDSSTSCGSCHISFSAFISSSVFVSFFTVSFDI